MVLPPPVYDPPFRITRASHVVLEVDDLDVSQSFYADVLGLILTRRDETTAFFRGIEEALDVAIANPRARASGCGF